MSRGGGFFPDTPLFGVALESTADPTHRSSSPFFSVFGLDIFAVLPFETLDLPDTEERSSFFAILQVFHYKPRLPHRICLPDTAVLIICELQSQVGVARFLPRAR